MTWILSDDRLLDSTDHLSDRHRLCVEKMTFTTLIEVDQGQCDLWRTGWDPQVALTDRAETMIEWYVPFHIDSHNSRYSRETTVVDLWRCPSSIECLQSPSEAADDSVSEDAGFRRRQKQ